MGKISFLSLSANISKTVADTAKVTILMTNRKSHMGFPLTPKSMTLDDLELVRSNCLGISRHFSCLGGNNS